MAHPSNSIWLLVNLVIALLSPFCSKLNVDTIIDSGETLLITKNEEELMTETILLTYRLESKLLQILDRAALPDLSRAK